MLESFQVDGHERIGSSGDSHYVFVRPKSYVDSSGTTWASETVWLRHNFPLDFEVDKESSRSVTFRKLLATLHDYAYQFRDMTMNEDLNRMSPGNLECVHVIYELDRLEHLIAGMEKVIEMSYNPQLKISERETVHELNVEKLYDFVKEFHDSFKDNTNKNQILQTCSTITCKLDLLLKDISQLNPLPVKPRWCDLTDRGPGVAVSNYDVRFRNAKMSRMWNSDYHIRLHLSRNDSHSNEAERTNSAIGDSSVDGETIEWEHVKLFDGISDEEISKMTLSEFDKHQEIRMKKNAYLVRDEVVHRIDGAPCLKEEIKAFPSPDHTFFFDKKQIAKHHSTTNKDGDLNSPGYHYFQKIMNYIGGHYRFGQLYTWSF